jgi:RNA polymerase sigma-70 factor (ECF subfamily)
LLPKEERSYDGPTVEESTSEQAADLAIRFVDGRRDAHETVRRWVADVVRFGAWRFADPEGVIQEVLLELLVSLRAGEYEERGGLRGFVGTVARRTCIDRYRREKFRGAFERPAPDLGETPASDKDPERRVQARQQLERLIYIHQRLSADCRRLWRLVYGEHLSAKEVAQRLGLAAGAVRVRVHRCLEQAREIHGRHAASAGTSRS